jgi:hypothetical protein
VQRLLFFFEQELSCRRTLENVVPVSAFQLFIATPGAPAESVADKAVPPPANRMPML